MYTTDLHRTEVSSAMVVIDESTTLVGGIQGELWVVRTASSE